MTSNCWVVNQNFQLVQPTKVDTLCPLTFSVLLEEEKRQITYYRKLLLNNFHWSPANL